MTIVDFFFGRYKRPSYDAYEDETKIERLNAEAFEIKSAEAFIETPAIFDENIEASSIREERDAQKSAVKNFEKALKDEGFITDFRQEKIDEKRTNLVNKKPYCKTCA